jgi:hypothetical protein
LRTTPSRESARKHKAAAAICECAPSQAIPRQDTQEDLKSMTYHNGLYAQITLCQPLGMVGVKSSQVNTLPKAKSKTRSKQNKDMHKCSFCQFVRNIINFMSDIFP